MHVQVQCLFQKYGQVGAKLTNQKRRAERRGGGEGQDELEYCYSRGGGFSREFN